ncbi:MAG: dienelactone hydrolase family protein [Pirellulaceae bacterium]
MRQATHCSSTIGTVVAVVMLMVGPGPRFLTAQERGAALAGDRRAAPYPLAEFCTPPPEWSGQLGSYSSPLRFADGRPVAAADWPQRRDEIMAMWHRRLGAWPPLLEKPAVSVLDTTTREGATQYHLRIQVSPRDDFTDAYLLIPAGSGPFPAVLVTFYEPLTSIGLGKRGQGTHDYGWQLVKRGFVTLSIGTPGPQGSLDQDTRELLIGAGKRTGLQPLTFLAYVAANCHTVLAQRAEVDAKRIGVIGLSYGGKWSMFASCLYDKFACAVWSDPGVVFNERNANVNYWEPWYLGYDPDMQRKPGIPSDTNPRTGLYRQMVEADEDLVDLHALAAPRPILVSGGTEDPPRNWMALNHLIAVNELLGYSQRVALTARKTHVPTAAALEQELAFLSYWLK